MTGLDRKNDTIMSICCIITDAQLNVVDPTGYEVMIHHDQSAMDKMGEWCASTHGRTGLTAACLASSIDAEEAADGLLAYIKQHVPYEGVGLLAGSSVHCDKEFLSKEPYDRVIRYLHFRILDVSSIKEAVKRWSGEYEISHVPPKKGLHEAREDILDSIEEARYYRKVFFQPKGAKIEKKKE